MSHGVALGCCRPVAGLFPRKAGATEQFGDTMVWICWRHFRAAAVPGSADCSASTEASACCMPGWWSFTRGMQKVLSSLLDVDRLVVAMPLEVAAETGLFSVFGEGFADRRPYPPAPARAGHHRYASAQASRHLAQDPGVFHDTPAGDVDQAAAGRGDAGHGAGHDLDGLRVRCED